MNRWLRPLRRLQWQLTLSYMLVTVVATLTLIVATVALTAITLQPKTASKGFIDKGVVQSMTYDVAPYITPYLEQNPPDLHDLTRRLVSMTQPIAPIAKNTAQTASIAPAGNPDLLVVLDHNNKPLAISGGDNAAIQAILAEASVQSATQDAWTGDQVSEGLAAHLSDSRSAAASPLVDYTGQVVGVALGIYSVPRVEAAVDATQNSQTKAVAEVLAQLIPSTLFFILATSALGIGTGIVFSRGLTRRLKRIANAAHDWSRGDLDVTIADRAHDEIGQLAHELNDMAGQLQQLVTARQALAVVEERRRLARDLHDSIKQQLFVMTMLIGAARAHITAQPHVVQTLGDAEQIAIQAHQELTALIRALRPVGLIGKQFGAALRELVASWSSASGIDAVMHLPETLAAPPEVEQALFRVTQEALANVARHSGATSVTVAAHIDGASLRLTIVDNGHGFDPEHVGERGFGLTSMRERVAAVAGMLHVASGATGTRIEAQCPLQAESPSIMEKQVS